MWSIHESKPDLRFLKMEILVKFTEQIGILVRSPFCSKKGKFLFSKSGGLHLLSWLSKLRKSFPENTTCRIYRRQSKPQRRPLFFPSWKNAGNLQAINSALQRVFKWPLIHKVPVSNQNRSRFCSCRGLSLKPSSLAPSQGLPVVQGGESKDTGLQQTHIRAPVEAAGRGHLQTRCSRLSCSGKLVSFSQAITRALQCSKVPLKPVVTTKPREIIWSFWLQRYRFPWKWTKQVTQLRS